jgi:Crp-like helix-turn-helix protein
VPTWLCSFPRCRLEALLEEIPKLEQRLLGMASHDLAAAHDQMMLLGRKSARERIASFILMLSDAAVRHRERADPAFLPMGRSDIADYLGLTTETVSRTLTRLKTQGLIGLVDDKHIRLSNPEALAEIAGGFWRLAPIHKRRYSAISLGIAARIDSDQCCGRVLLLAKWFLSLGGAMHAECLRAGDCGGGGRPHCRTRLSPAGQCRASHARAGNEPGHVAARKGRHDQPGCAARKGRRAAC